MKLSIKEIRSKFDKRFILITAMGWVESNGHLLGILLKDSHTGRIYFRTNSNPSNPSYEQIIESRRIFLSKFRYTHQLSCFNRFFNTILCVIELHGFRKDM